MKLPSKLNTFEQFLFFDDYPAYPNTIGCRLNLTGRLDEALLHQALKVACDRNPLLKTTLQVNWNRPKWVDCHDTVVAERLPDQYIDEHFVKKIDLGKETGGQLHWACADNRVSLNLLTHHAAADGIGGLQVVDDLMSAYSLLHSEDRPEHADLEQLSSQMRRVDAELLNKRGRYGFCRWRFLKTFPRQMIGLYGVKEFLVNRPVTLTNQPLGPIEDPVPEDYPGLISLELAETEKVRKQAGTEQVTHNDLILQCIFLAMAKWRREHQFGDITDLLRVMVPINLRSIGDRYLSACHRSSMVSLDRKEEDCLDAKKLLNSIRFQMQVIKANQLGYTFLHMLNLSRWMPRGVRRYADPNRIGSTVVVTNLGEPFRRVKLPRNEEGKLLVGEMVLDEVELIAPLRPNTQAAFAICRYAGKTTLSLTYDNRIIDDQLARGLVQRVADEFHAKTADAS